MKSAKGRAIVLNTLKYGESSLIVHLYTESGGRESFLLSGVRSRGKGNRAALCQPMCHIEYESAEWRPDRMARLKEMRSLTPLLNTTFDPCKSTVSIFMAEVIYRLVREEEPNPPFYEFLGLCVESLNVLERGTANFHLWFLVRLTGYLGFFPERNYSEASFFDIKSGSFTVIPPLHRMFFDREQSALLARLMECYNPMKLDEFALNRRQRRTFLETMLNFIGYHTESIHSVRSVEILKEVF